MAVDTLTRPGDYMGLDNISGSRAAILKATGVDIQEFPQVMDGSGSATAWGNGHPRPKTTQHRHWLTPWRWCMAGPPPMLMK